VSAARMIRVWRWSDAPKAYCELSRHGGDEDWVAFVPKPISQPLWMESGTAFGCCAVSEHNVFGGTVYIGAHA
jgi:hypothetical protein